MTLCWDSTCVNPVPRHPQQLEIPGSVRHCSGMKSLGHHSLKRQFGRAWKRLGDDNTWNLVAVVCPGTQMGLCCKSGLLPLASLFFLFRTLEALGRISSDRLQHALCTSRSHLIWADDQGQKLRSGPVYIHGTKQQASLGTVETIRHPAHVRSSSLPKGVRDTDQRIRWEICFLVF